MRGRHFYTATTTFPNNWFHTALAPGKQSTSKYFKTSLMEWWTKEQHLNPFFRHSLVQKPLRWWEAPQFGFRDTQYRAVIHSNFFWQPSFAVQGSSLSLQHFEQLSFQYHQMSNIHKVLKYFKELTFIWRRFKHCLHSYASSAFNLLYNLNIYLKSTLKARI